MKKSQLRYSLLAASALSASIASQLHAAAFISTAAGGNWSDPLSWTAGVGFPDTFLGDSATVVLGAAVDYTGGQSTPASPSAPLLGAGGLAVADGGSILLDGGTLTQAGFPNEIRIGDGGGALTGVGSLTIRNGGAFLSLFSAGVAIGSDLSSGASGHLGNGTVNIEDGLFLMGVGPGLPAPSAALGVGIEGSTGVLNVGDGIGAAETATLDLEGGGTDAINLGIGVANPVTGSPAGNGTVTVKADGKILQRAGAIVVGDKTTGGIGTGVLSIAGGKLGTGASSLGGLTVGSGGGNGTFNVSGGGIVNTGDVFTLGIGAGSVGTSTVSGVGTTVIFGNNVYVDGGGAKLGSARIGRDGGTGTLSVSGGATFESGADEGTNTKGFFLGSGSTGSVGTVNVDGGTFTQHGWAEIGSGTGNTGTINVSNGGVFTHPEASRDFQLGYNGGTGNINVTSGGSFTQNWWLNVARGGGSVGNVTVDGTGSAVGSTKVVVLGGGDQRTNIGEDGTGTLTVSHGGLETNLELIVGRNGGSSGTVNINTGGVVLADRWLSVGNSAGATGVINIDGVGSRLTALSLVDGRNAGAGGDTQVGLDGGTGTLNVTNGGTFETGWWLNIARGGGSTGTVNIDGPGSKVNVGIPTLTGPHIGQGGDAKTQIGENGTGTLTLTNGASLQAGYLGGQGGRELYIGRNGGSNGTLNISSNSKVHADGGWSVIVADNGGSTATINADSGGQLLANNWIVIGNNGGSNATVNISGPTYDSGTGLGTLIQSGTPAGVSHEGRLITGRQGTATVNQTGGTVQADNWFAIGIDGGGTGTYNFDGGKIELAMPDFGARNITVGNHGTGSLNITNGTPAGDTIVGIGGGRINQFNVAGDSGGNGTLNINLTDPAGKIVSRELYAGWNNGANGTINVLKGTLQTDEWVEIGRGQNGQSGTGTVNIDGAQAKWDRGITSNVRKDMNVGQGENDNLANGTINVKNGGTVTHNWWLNLGRQHLAQGHVTVDGVGSTFNIIPAPGQDHNAQINVGENGTGTLDITNGGVFNHMVGAGNGGGEIYVSRNGSANGRATVDGAGSQWNAQAREFRVAADGTGVLNVQNGGVVNYSSHNEDGTVANGNFGVAENNAANGTVNVNGGQLNIDAWATFAAWQDNAAASVATLNVTNGSVNLLNGSGDHGRLLWGRRGTATINQSGGTIHVANWAVLGVEAGGTGTWNIGNGGTAILDDDVSVGRLSTGTLNVSGVGTTFTVTTKALYIGQDGGGNGTVNQTGGTVTEVNQWTTIGANGGSNGTYNISGGVLNPHFLEVGADGTGTMNVSGTGQVLAQSVTIGTRNTGVGVLNVNGGLLKSDGHISIGGDQSGGTGTLNINGGVVATHFISSTEATDAVNAATLTFAGGTLQLLGTEGDLIRGFTNTGTHSGINFNGSGGTIDTNGFDGRIKAGNVIVTTDVSGIDGQAGTVITKAGAGTLAFEPALVGGTISVRVKGGTFSQQGPANLDNLTIDGGAIYVIDTLGAPPPAPAFAAAADALGGTSADAFDGDSGLIAGGGGAGASELAAGASVQGVPEPGTLSLLLISGLGLLGRCPRGKRA